MYYYYISAIYIVLFILSFVYITQYGNEDFKITTIYTAVLVFTLSLVIRIYFALDTFGYNSDIVCFKSWAMFSAEKGLNHFYSGEIFADYPPGYIYILFIIGKIRSLLSINPDSQVFVMMLKMPAIIADIIISYIIYKESSGRLNKKAALLLSVLYLFNPAVIFDSSVWGQVDSVFTLLLLLSFIWMDKRHAEFSIVLFIAAVLVKPQSLMFTPVFIYFLIKKKDLKLFFKSIFYGVLIFVCAVIPFAAGKPALWIINKYLSTVGSYPYAAINAFNLYTLLGANWISDTSGFLGISYKTFSSIIIVLTVIFSGIIYFRAHRNRQFKAASFIVITVFMLVTDMHERYLYPALCFLLMCYDLMSSKSYLMLFAGFSITSFLNVVYVLEMSYKGIYQIPVNRLIIVISVLNIFLLICFYITVFKKSSRRKIIYLNDFYK